MGVVEAWVPTVRAPLHAERIYRYRYIYPYVSPDKLVNISACLGPVCLLLVCWPCSVLPLVDHTTSHCCLHICIKNGKHF